MFSDLFYLCHFWLFFIAHVMGVLQVTLDDFYSLDMGAMTEWRTLSLGTYDQQVWEESDSSSEEDDSEEAESDEEI